ncbi:MAG TPA: catalase family peroxidase [Solirubrobacteraceae bacterium]|nr:catalase family peroxidase [Solirubrobacteraceae bacterium]
MTPTPQESTAAANALYGRHPGFRALHAKGTLLKGTFTATPQASQLTRAAHMQGEPVPVTARVSNGGGNPRVPDYAADVRGLAVKLYLPDGSRTDIVTQTVPHFPVSTPEAFLELLHAQAAGRAAPLKLSLFLARHPGAIPSLPGNLAALRPVPSYAACRYYAVHAYRFVDASGGSRYVRYTFVPEREEARLWPWQARGLGRDYLQEEISSRVAAGPVRFALELQIAAPGDMVDDPSAEWPADRERVDAGTLELTGLETERETDGDVLVFDPGRVTDGIELSDDPVLRYRPAAYGDSVAARTGG